MINKYDNGLTSFSFKQVKFGKFLTKLQNLENEKKIQLQF